MVRLLSCKSWHGYVHRHPIQHLALFPSQVATLQRSGCFAGAIGLAMSDLFLFHTRPSTLFQGSQGHKKIHRPIWRWIIVVVKCCESSAKSPASQEDGSKAYSSLFKLIRQFEDLGTISKTFKTHKNTKNLWSDLPFVGHPGSHALRALQFQDQHLFRLAAAIGSE